MASQGQTMLKTKLIRFIPVIRVFMAMVDAIPHWARVIETKPS